MQEAIISSSEAGSIITSTTKWKLPADYEPHDRAMTTKRAKLSFDDSTSDDEEETLVDSSDSISTPDDSFVGQYIEHEVEVLKIFGTEKQDRSKALEDLMDGMVFFNHFVRTETTIRPSLLMKAWNRSAALMMKPRAAGVDFAIPVIINRNVKDEFGPLFGPWTDQQEKLADVVIAYLLIQTKLRATTCPSMVRDALTTCIPMTRKLRPRDPIPTFTKHNPSNYYVSLLMELDIEDERRVHLMNVVDYEGLQKKIAKIAEKEEKLRKSEVNTVSPRKIKEMEKELEDEKKDLDCEMFWLPIREKQLPIVAYGLTQYTYKCLESRPNVTQMLHQLAQPDLNPLRGLTPQEAAALRAGRHLMIHPDWEYSARRMSA